MHSRVGAAVNLIRVILLCSQPQMLPRAHHFRLARRTALYSAKERQELVGVCHFHLPILFIYFTSTKERLPALMSAEEEGGWAEGLSLSLCLSLSLSAGTLACHCEFPQRWHDTEAAGRLINTGIRRTPLNTCVSPPLTSSPLQGRRLS